MLCGTINAGLCNIMLQSEKTRAESPEGGESLLRTEIQFWRELINSKNQETCSAETLERMRQALALAEYRLCHSGDEYSEFAAAPAHGDSSRKKN